MDNLSKELSTTLVVLNKFVRRECFALPNELLNLIILNGYFENRSYPKLILQNFFDYMDNKILSENNFCLIYEYITKLNKNLKERLSDRNIRYKYIDYFEVKISSELIDTQNNFTNSPNGSSVINTLYLFKNKIHRNYYLINDKIKGGFAYTKVDTNNNCVTTKCTYMNGDPHSYTLKDMRLQNINII